MLKNDQTKFELCVNIARLYMNVFNIMYVLLLVKQM